MNNATKSKWRWRLLRWGLIGLAGLVTLAAVLVTEENWRGKHEWDAFRRDSAAHGDNLDLASVIPAPVPDSENFFAAPVVADSINLIRQEDPADLKPRPRNDPRRLEFDFERGSFNNWTNGGDWQKRTLTDLKQWQAYFRNYNQSPAGRTNGFPATAEPQTPAADILLALSAYDPDVEALRQAARRPQARFPLNYDDGFEDVSVLLRWIPTQKRSIQLLQLRALAGLNAGQERPALDDIELSLRLMDCTRNQPYLISHLVRLAIAAYVLQPIYEGLARHCWNDAELAELENTLEKQDFLADFQRAIRGERACGISYFETQRLTRELKYPNEMATYSLAFMPSAYFYQNELAVARIQGQFVLPQADPASHQISLAVYRAGQKYLQEATNHFSPYSIQALMSFSAVSKCILKFGQTQTELDEARIACALERYRLAHGDYPAALDPLAPQFIASLPLDLINGQPLHYRREADGGYVLYSVGWNETDDGGVVVQSKTGRIDREKGDWVWQLPPK